MPDENLINLQHFFEADVKIKKEMVASAPPGINQYVDINKYSDTVNDSLIYIFAELKSMASDIFGSDSFVMKRLVAMENVTMNSFYSCCYDMDKLRAFYNRFVTNMEVDFENLVRKECMGYVYCEMNSPQKAASINEMLHFMHSYVLNNNSILQSIPKVDEKINDYNYPITYRGYKVKTFEQLYEQFPNDLDVGRTDMVAISDRKMLMMVRDRGHALTIEISINNEIARLEYFVPKICNVEMVNNLPGLLNKVNENSVGATGVIEVPINDLQNTLYDFISRVPTDDDMEILHRK